MEARGSAREERDADAGAWTAQVSGVEILRLKECGQREILLPVSRIAAVADVGRDYDHEPDRVRLTLRDPAEEVYVEVAFDKMESLLRSGGVRE